jgi:hypothetical protein
MQWYQRVYHAEITLVYLYIIMEKLLKFRHKQLSVNLVQIQIEGN